MNRLRHTSTQPAQPSHAPNVFAKGRVCSYPPCKTQLSRYHANTYCYLHAPTEPPRRAGRGTDPVNWTRNGDGLLGMLEEAVAGAVERFP